MTFINEVIRDVYDYFYPKKTCTTYLQQFGMSLSIISMIVNVYFPGLLGRNIIADAIMNPIKTYFANLKTRLWDAISPYVIAL